MVRHTLDIEVPPLLSPETFFRSRPAPDVLSSTHTLLHLVVQTRFVCGYGYGDPKVLILISAGAQFLLAWIMR